MVARIYRRNSSCVCFCFSHNHCFFTHSYPNYWQPQLLICLFYIINTCKKHQQSLGSDFSTFCFLLCFLFILSSTKHSYLDRETSLILKSIAGKPTHLLTKVTFSYTYFPIYFPFIFLLHVYTLASLLLHVQVGKSMLQKGKDRTLDFVIISQLKNWNKIVNSQIKLEIKQMVSEIIQNLPWKHNAYSLFLLLVSNLILTRTRTFD